MFEGVLVHEGEEKQQGGITDSPSKQRKTATVRKSIVLMDGFGPMLVSLKDDAVAAFIFEKGKNMEKQKIIVNLDRMQVGYIVENDWNGKCLTQLRLLYSVPAMGNTPGTNVRIVAEAESPYMDFRLFQPPGPLSCISQFSIVRSRLIAPFRATFRGIVADLKGHSYSTGGNPKRDFILVDNWGSYMHCCAA